MDKGCGPPPTLHDLGRPPNGQGFRAPPPTLHDLLTTGKANPSQGPPPQPFTTCKWTRVGGPTTLHHLQMDKGCLHDLQMDKGSGPQLANGQGLGAPQPFTTCKWTTVGRGLGPPGVPPITSITVGQGLDSLNLSRFGVAPQINFAASTYVSTPTRRLVRRSTNQ